MSKTYTEDEVMMAVAGAIASIAEIYLENKDQLLDGYQVAHYLAHAAELFVKDLPGIGDAL